MGILHVGSGKVVLLILKQNPSNFWGFGNEVPTLDSHAVCLQDSSSGTFYNIWKYLFLHSQVML